MALPSAVSKETPKTASVRKNIAWYLGGNIIYSASQFFLVIILARLSNPAIVGIYGAAKALTQPPMIFASLNLRQYLAATRSTEFKFAEMLGLRIVALVAAMIFILSVAWLRHDREFLMIVLFVALTAVFDMLSDVIYGIFQQNEQLSKISISRSLQGVLQIVTFGVTYFITRGLLVSCAALFLMSAVITFAYDIPNLRLLYIAQQENKLPDSATEIVLKPSFNLERMRKLFVMVFPLAVMWVFLSLHVNIGRYVVESKLGRNDLGFLTTMITLMSAAALAWSALGHSTTPRLAKLFATDRAAFRRLSKKILVLGVISGVINVLIGLFAGEFVLDLLLGKQYAAYHLTFTWLLAGHGVSYLVATGRDSVTAAQSWKLQPYTNGLGALAILLACNYYVPLVGIIGVGYAYFIGMSIMAVIYLVELCLFTWRAPDLPAVATPAS